MNFNAQQSFSDVVYVFVGFINMLVPVLGGLALVLFFWGIVRYVYHAGDPKSKNQDREMILWGLVALFVLFSIWGILRFLTSSFLGGSYVSPTPSERVFNPQSGTYCPPNC